MGWSAETTKEVNESSPGETADGDWITLMPNELCHYTVKRDDASPSDRWYVDVLSSTDGVREDNPPFERFIMMASELVKSVIVSSLYAFKVRIGNAEFSPGDTITSDHYWRKNGVSL